MTFQFIFEPDYKRIITAVIIDARASIPEIKNQTGVIIKDYIDSKIALINSAAIVYKIETELGVLAGYFVIQVTIKNKASNLVFKQLRSAFVQFDTELSLQISNFIADGSWKQDYLF